MWLPAAYNARLSKISSLLVFTILVGLFLFVAFFVFRYEDFQEPNYSEAVGSAVRETQPKFHNNMNASELANVMESLGQSVIQKMRLQAVEPVQSSQKTANLLLGIRNHLVSSMFSTFWLFGFVLSALLLVFALYFKSRTFWNDIDSLHIERHLIFDNFPADKSYNKYQSQQRKKIMCTATFHIFLLFLIGSILMFCTIASDNQIHGVFAFWKYVNGCEFIPTTDEATVWLLFGLAVVNSLILTISITRVAENIYSLYWSEIQ